jgi:hypothetical protein
LETIKDFDETIKKLKTDIENHDRSNMKLKEKIKQINLSHLNQNIKRQNSTIMRQQIIIKDLNLQQLTHWAAHQCAYQIHLKWI